MPRLKRELSTSSIATEFTGSQSRYERDRFHHQGGHMRSLVFGAVLIAVAAVGFQTLIAGALAAARHDRPATFSERFTAVYKP
jgi:hypothetical protein